MQAAVSSNCVTRPSCCACQGHTSNGVDNHIIGLVLVLLRKVLLGVVHCLVCAQFLSPRAYTSQMLVSSLVRICASNLALCTSR